MPFKIHKRGEIWHYRGTVAGRRLRGTTGTTEKVIAQRLAAEAEAQAWRNHLDGPEASVTMAQAAIAYRRAEKPTRFLEKIEDYWRDTPLRKITPGAVRQSAIELYPNAKGATRNRQVIVPTQAIINHAAEMGWCAPIKVKRFDVEAETKEPVTPEWVFDFVSHAPPHLGALCMFMFATGARIGEAVALMWKDVDLNEATARMWIKKPKPWERVAHLPPELVSAMANIPSNRNPDDRVFGYSERGSVKQPWDNAVKRAGIKRLTPHSCRHGFATEMLCRGFDPVTVAKRGGWKDPTTVVRTYGHAIEDQTVTNALFDTNIAQADTDDLLNHSNERKI